MPRSTTNIALNGNVDKWGLVPVLTAIVLIFGTTEAGTTPLHRGHADWLGIGPASVAGGAVDELIERLDRPEATAAAPFIRLRPSRRFLGTAGDHLDPGTLTATTGDQPISDVYDLVGIRSGQLDQAGHIDPRIVYGTPASRRPSSGHGRQTAPFRPTRTEPNTNPVPAAAQIPDGPPISSETLDLSLRTLDYLIIASRIIFEKVSGFLQ